MSVSEIDKTVEALKKALKDVQGLHDKLKAVEGLAEKLAIELDYVKNTLGRASDVLSEFRKVFEEGEAAGETVEIDLSALQKVGSCKCEVDKLLRAILEAWGVEHKIIARARFEGIEIYDEELKEILKGDEELTEWDVIDEESLRKYAERKGGKIVELFDGWDWAFAIVFPK